VSSGRLPILKSRQSRPFASAVAPVPGKQHDHANTRRRCRALRGSGPLRHRRHRDDPMTDIIDIETRRKKRKPSRTKPPPHETVEQTLRRALARATPRSFHCLSAKHEAAIFIWRAAEVADRDPDEAGGYLEMAAQRLWKGGGNEPPAGGAA
jgi:hypothetical protein